MGLEIERKFLVKDDTYKGMAEGKLYRQGYLYSGIDKVIRIRTVEDKAWLTIKGKNIGAVRDEFEYEIPYTDAEEILNKLCEKPVIEKTRYRIDINEHTWEIDEFHGENEGLIIAEIELTDENEKFEKPDWIDNEVTGNLRYYSSNLIKDPYKRWR